MYSKLKFRAFLIVFLMLFLRVFKGVEGQSFKATQLDQFLQLYRNIRKGGLNILGRNSENPQNMAKARSLNMLQELVPLSVPFPCNVTGFRSTTPPLNVNEVRPGDIDVIGALGDSLTAGNGLVATSVFHVLMENRGLVWSIGGQGTWREFLTLPNILKEFNPKLIGYSLRDSITIQRDSQFNPAEAAAISSELPYMTKVLIKRIKSDPRVDVKQHWKLITIMIGANDHCLDICYKANSNEVIKNHRNDLINVLRLLKENLPRTIVNIVSPPDVRLLLTLKGIPQVCNVLHKLVECFCLVGDVFRRKRNIMNKIINRWLEMDEEIANMPEFNQDDFTVIYQPFIRNVEVPKTATNLTDLSFLSQDCFHVSQKLNAEVALALWNNMLERVGNKTRTVHRLFERFLCPTEENPFIFTKQNSR